MGRRNLGLTRCHSSVDGFSFGPFPLSLSSLLSCWSPLTSVKDIYCTTMETQPSIVVVSSSQHYPPPINPSSVWYFVLLLPFQVYSSSPANCGCPWSHPPLLCPLTTWHLFRFIPISWQAACISPRGYNAAILTNQWQINQCYLFFPCLCCHWFFFCYFAVCGDLNFAQLNWVHFQEQSVIA